MMFDRVLIDAHKTSHSMRIIVNAVKPLYRAYSKVVVLRHLYGKSINENGHFGQIFNFNLQ